MSSSYVSHYENFSMQYTDFVHVTNIKFHPKHFNIFDLFAQNINRGCRLEPPRRGGFKEYPKSMFWIKNKKNRYTLVNPSFNISKWGLRGYTLHGHVSPKACLNMEKWMGQPPKSFSF